MKEAIAGSWVYMIVIIFMVILISYVAITLNYSNTFEMNENMIKTVEQYEGLNPQSLEMLDKIVKGNNHTVVHSCGYSEQDDTMYYGVKDKHVDRNPKRNDYQYCIGRYDVTTAGTRKYYYKIKIFFTFSVPVLGDLYAFTVQGETSGLSFVNDSYF